jgi:hypothetical protein
MKRVDNKGASATRKTAKRRERATPLIVPYGGAEAGRDFESAFEVLRRDECVHELWRREPTKKLVQAC